MIVFRLEQLALNEFVFVLFCFDFYLCVVGPIALRCFSAGGATATDEEVEPLETSVLLAAALLLLLLLVLLLPLLLALLLPVILWLLFVRRGVALPATPVFVFA